MEGETEKQRPISFLKGRCFWRTLTSAPPYEILDPPLSRVAIYVIKMHVGLFLGLYLY